MEQYALIVAGGKGTRMNADLPKQFLPIAGKPVLMHTLQLFFDANCKLILVLPQDQFLYWQQLCIEYDFTIPHQLINGGATRFDSVQNGLAVIPNESLVAIHDGVRPCVTQKVIRNTFDIALQKGNAIAAVNLKDSIRVVDGDDNHSVDRAHYKSIQTPQTFKSTVIKSAYAQSSHPNFTDDASVLEASGLAIHLVDGDYQNIKITTPEDLVFAEAILKGTTK